MNFVEGDEPPFLLIHGTGDKLQQTGGKADLVWLPGAGHIAPLAAFYDPKRDPAVLQAIKAFVASP